MSTFRHGTALALRAAALAVVGPAVAVAFAAPALATPTAGTAAAAGTGTIQGFVWDDLNRNGIQDAGEPGAAGVTVGYQQIIDGRPGLFYAKVTTGHDGAYSIVDLPAGEYRAVASTVVWLFTTASAGEDRAKDSDFAGYIDNPAAPQQVAMTSNVTVDAGGTVVLDAGVVKREP